MDAFYVYGSHRGVNEMLQCAKRSGPLFYPVGCWGTFLAALRLERVVISFPSRLSSLGFSSERDLSSFKGLWR